MEKLMGRYPNRVPVIVEPASTTSIEQGTILKYMVEKDRTIASFLIQLRKHIHMSSKKAIFIFVNNCLPPNSYTVGQVWELHKSEDGILRIRYSLENTFG
jgi:GABA(A) receptor-associated protein